MNDNKDGVSVVICCYNSVNRLKPTLEHLSQQIVSESISWEIILVDNNSNDGTGKYATEIWNDLDCIVSFRIVNESNTGLSNARKRGIATSKYNYIIFCDDDNWLSSNYINVAFNIMETNNTIGLAGGWCTPISNINLPSWFTNAPMFFAVGKQYTKTGVVSNYLYGAGLIIRRKCFQELEKTKFSFLLTDRKGKNLSSGGDVELCYAIQLLGYKLWYDERLYFKHYIDNNRLSLDYYVKLRKGITKSDIILNAYRNILNGTKVNILNIFYLTIKFFIKLPIIGLQYLAGNKTKSLINYYYYYYNIRYYSEFTSALIKIKEWEKGIKKESQY